MAGSSQPMDQPIPMVLLGMVNKHGIGQQPHEKTHITTTLQIITDQTYGLYSSMSKHGLRIMRTVSQRSFAQEVPVTRRQVLWQNTKMSIHCHEVLTIRDQQFPSSPPSSHIITIPGLERRLSCPSYRVALKPPSTRRVNRVNNRVASYIIDIPTLLAIMYQIGKGCSTPDILNHVWSGECHGISTSNSSPLVVPAIDLPPFTRQRPRRFRGARRSQTLWDASCPAAERDANLGSWHRECACTYP